MYNFFTSKSYEIAFYLTQLEGTARADKLQITRACFTVKKVADNFYNTNKEILQQLDNKDLKEKAMQELENIYREMIG